MATYEYMQETSGRLAADNGTVFNLANFMAKRSLRKVTATVTRPANTTAYTAGDVVGTSPATNIAFSGMGYNAGDGFQILGARLTIPLDALPSGMTTHQLHLYSSAPTAIADNAAFNIIGGTAQVETATVVGTITTAGNASVTITSALMENSPKTVSVAVALSDNAASVAGKIRTALAADADVIAVYSVGGSSATVTLTDTTLTGNDSTLNIAIANGTCAGLTAAPTSADTTAGVANDRVKYLGFITFTAPVDLGDTLVSQVDSLTFVGKLDADSTTVYGVLETVGAYTPTSGIAETITLFTAGI